MSKLLEITVTESGFVVPEPWLTRDGQPTPGVYAVVPKEKLTQEALAKAIAPYVLDSTVASEVIADAVLDSLGGGE